jgi:hypothetical protein
MTRHIRRIGQRGAALFPLIIAIPALILITALYMGLAVSSYRIAGQDQLRTHAQFAVDAGIDSAVQKINQDDTWTGTGADVPGGEIDLHDDGQVRTTYEVEVLSPSDDNKTLIATGRSYRTSDATPQSSIIINVDLRPVASGNYSVVSGVGGLVMSNNAKILGGDVFINGDINMSNSAQIGLASNSANIEVAHQNCPDPPDATYPRICNSGENGEPISINHTAIIYGSVKANNQTDGSGMSNPGLVAGSGVAAQPLPTHDREAQKTAINNADAANAPDAQSGASAGCSSGTKTWPANLKIIGNVTISNTCDVTVEGDIWITGRLRLTNSSKLIVSDSLGGTRPVIMIDGAEGVSLSNGTLLKSNSSDTGFQLITYWSDSTCSPDCPDVTGQDLYNSRSEPTISLANSSEGPQSIFYARWSKVSISNSGQIGALVGQTVELSNNSAITFGSSVGVGGKTFWVIDGYRRVYD